MGKYKYIYVKIKVVYDLVNFLINKGRILYDLINGIL